MQSMFKTEVLGLLAIVREYVFYVFQNLKKMCFYVFLKRHVKKHRKHYQSFRMITLLTFQLAYTMCCEIIVCQFEVH